MLPVRRYARVVKAGEEERSRGRGRGLGVKIGSAANDGRRVQHDRRTLRRAALGSADAGTEDAKDAGTVVAVVMVVQGSDGGEGARYLCVALLAVPQ
jgi:hypothetical protein